MKAALATRFRTGLWTNHHFLRLWASDTISVFGGEITKLALPLTAALLLSASPTQMGLLVAMEVLPFGLFSLLAGVWLDRHRKLPLIRAAAISRGVLLMSIPLAAWLGVLSMPLLYLVGFLMSTHSVFVDVAYQALVVRLVGREQLVDANTNFGLSESSANIAGPSLAGLLVQWLTAPFAILADALSFFASGLLLRTVRVGEPEPARRPAGITLWHEIREGLAMVWGNGVLRWTVLLLAAWQLFHHMFIAIFVLYAVRDVGLAPSVVGIVFSMGGVGFLLGSLGIARATARLGLGPVMLAGMAATTVGWGTIALAHGPIELAMLEIGLALLVEGIGVGLFFLAYISLRQAITPEPMLGRVISTMRWLAIAGTPLGALAGGALGEAIGLRTTIGLIGVAGVALSAAAWVNSPLRRVRELPDPLPVVRPITEGAGGN